MKTSLTANSVSFAIALLLTSNTTVLAYTNGAPAFTTAPPTRPSLQKKKSFLPTNQVEGGTASTWRVALNIGNTWPVVFKCDFDEQNNRAIPQDDYIRYTGRNGEVVKPIDEGTWSLESSSYNISEGKKLTFTVNFPEDMSRNELKLNAGTVTCEGVVYTQEDLKVLNDNFYRAREKTWELGGQLNEIEKRRDAPKKWNEETQRWEKRYTHEPVWSYLAKRAEHMKLKAQESQELAKRPDPNTLSTQSGYFPGFDKEQQVFVGKMGVLKQGLKVIGTWAAEPVNDRPVSYVGN